MPAHLRGAEEQPMPTNAIRMLTILLAIVVIGAFALIFGEAIVEAWRCYAKGPPPKPFQAAAGVNSTFASEIDDPYTYVATAIGVLVGGIVAVAFGRPAPPIGLRTADPRKWLIAIYAAIYVITGIAAIITWVEATSCTPVLVRNLATTFLGLLLPVVANYFQQGGTSDREHQNRGASHD
jgi:hypothetical protein